jgi:hypothetical protein
MPADDAAVQVHELEQFLRQDQAGMVAEYDRIFARATEDPGTAGDEGEENWASLLRQWLPAGYTVVTKGRVLFTDKTASPQVDVVVLRPGYPSRLLDKKLYLSSGVLAAFECKTTLKSEHIGKAATTAALVKSKSNRRSTGTPRDELQTAPYFGLLAHSHPWKSPGSAPRDNVDSAITPLVLGDTHPSEWVNIVCVADLGAWTSGYFLECPKFYDPISRDLRVARGVNPDGQVQVHYTRFREEMFDPEADIEPPNPIAVLMNSLFSNLAWDDLDLRPTADYFRLTGLGGSGAGLGRTYALDEVLSAPVRQRLDVIPPSMGPQSFWDPWSFTN